MFIYSLEEMSLLSVLRTALGINFLSLCFKHCSWHLECPSHLCLSVSFYSYPKGKLGGQLTKALLVCPGAYCLLYLRSIQESLETCLFLSFMCNDLDEFIVVCSSSSEATFKQGPGNTYCYGLYCVLHLTPTFLCWSPNLQFLRMCLYLEIKSLKMYLAKLRWSHTGVGWVPSPK